LRSLTTLCGEYSAALDRPCRHLSLSGAQYPMSSYTRQHLERLQRDGMDGRTALEIVGSVMYFARKNPKVLPDDIRFTLHLGYSICHALPLPQYPKVSWRTGQQYNVSRAAPRTP
jgi:hypothetical protein